MILNKLREEVIEEMSMEDEDIRRKQKIANKSENKKINKKSEDEKLFDILGFPE